MKLKRWLALALALATATTLTACSNSNGGDTNTPSGSPAPSGSQAAVESDTQYVKNKGTLVVGITEFAPMDYKDDNGQWTGFDAELARLVAQRLGVDVEFVVIEWGQKVNELNSKAIDVVWNGMTLTDGVTSAMACTNAYCKNAQVVVVRGQ